MLADVDGNGCDSSVSQICILLLLIWNSLVLIFGTLCHVISLTTLRLPGSGDAKAIGKSHT